MNWVEVFVLSIVQGLTEFLPISSSAHLRITSELFFDRDAGASFTAVTQLGTEAAVLVYFARDIFRIARTWIVGIWDRSVRDSFDYRMGWYVIIGTLPIGILGYLFQDEIRSGLRNLWITAAMLIGFGVVLAVAERLGRKQRRTGDLTLRDSIVMGLAQSLALIPGVSRSGATISAGMFDGLTREAATRFAFLLAIPAVVTSGLFSIPDLFESGGPGLTPSGGQMLVATVIAFVVGYASIAWLLRYVAHHTLYLFAAYRLLLGGLVMVLLGMGVISAT